jgi:hypothetical protein
MSDSSNGNLPDNVLVVVGPTKAESGEQKLNSSAASAWDSMKNAALKDGITLTIDKGYRRVGSKEEGCKGGFTQWCAYIQSKNGGNTAAYPGTSNHGWGSAIDFAIGDDPELNGKSSEEKKVIKKKKLDWLKNNASKFGFFATVAGENWHYDHKSSIESMKSGNYGEVKSKEEPKKEKPEKPKNYDFEPINIEAPRDNTDVKLESFTIKEEIDRMRDIMKKILKLKG